jgi:hypothetical protein
VKIHLAGEYTRESAWGGNTFVVRVSCTPASGSAQQSSSRAEPPARGGLERHLQILAAEAAQESPHALTVRRRDARSTELARLTVQPLSGDLRSVLVKSHYDCHTGPPQAPRFDTCADLPRLS